MNWKWLFKPISSHSARPLDVIALIIGSFLIVSFYEVERLESSFKYDQLKNETSELSINNMIYQLVSSIKAGKEYIYLSDIQKAEQSFITNITTSPILFLDNKKNYPKVAKGIVTNFFNTKELWFQSESDSNNSLSKKIYPPYTILIIGDSMISEEVGIHFENKFSQWQDCKVLRKGVYSTGLSRIDYFNWLSHIKLYIKRYQPDILIVMLGTNDGQPLYSIKKKKAIPYRTKKWEKEYYNNVEAFINILEDKNLLTYWVGLPISERKNFNQKISQINTLQEKCANNSKQVHYVNTWKLFMKDDKILQFVKNEKGLQIRLRHKDGIHLRNEAANVLTDHVIREMEKKVVFYNKKNDKKISTNQ